MNAPLPSLVPNPGPEHAGRRSSSRLRTRLPAVILLHSGLFHVTLDNLALHGARVTLRRDQTAECHPGSNAVLQWGTYETFCTIRWQSGHSIGLEFDEALTQQDLIYTRVLDERAHLPAEKDQVRLAARDWVSGQRI